MLYELGASVHPPRERLTHGQASLVRFEIVSMDCVRSMNRVRFTTSVTNLVSSADEDGKMAPTPTSLERHSAMQQNRRTIDEMR